MTGVPRTPLPPLTLSEGALVRAAWNRDDATAGQRLRDPAARVLDVRGDLLPLRGERLVLRDAGPGDAGPGLLYLGEADGPRFAVLHPRSPEDADPDVAGDGHTEDADTDDADDVVRVSLREAGPLLEPVEIGLATTAVAMAAWRAAVRCCARCGDPVAPSLAGWVLRCPRGHDSYPQTSPAVIMAVTDDADRLLLARGPQWGADRRSVLAGFVEPGESLEQAVAREVREEVGLDVVDVRYEGNQPWPFPASLMVAFTCRATGTGIEVDPAEIADADWYTREQLADAVGRGLIGLPGPLSVAHHLVAQWYGGPLPRPLPGPQPAATAEGSVATR